MATETQPFIYNFFGFFWQQSFPFSMSQSSAVKVWQRPGGGGAGTTPRCWRKQVLPVEEPETPRFSGYIYPAGTRPA